MGEVTTGRSRPTFSDVVELCHTCHNDMSKHFHPLSGRWDPRTGEPLTCIGCRRPHASDQETLLTHEPKRELCLQCHDPNMAPP